MQRKPGDAYSTEFTTSNPTTGAAANADSLPVATANHNGTDDGTFSAALTVTNLDTGRYKITGTVPSGYAAGDTVTVTVAATCGGVAGKAKVDTFGVDTARASDIYGTISQSQINGIIGGSPTPTQISLTVGTLTSGGVTFTPPTGNLVGMMCEVQSTSPAGPKARLVIATDTGTTTRTLGFAAPGFAVAPNASDTVAIS
jgi:hypothetical protein